MFMQDCAWINMCFMDNIFSSNSNIMLCHILAIWILYFILEYMFICNTKNIETLPNNNLTTKYYLMNYYGQYSIDYKYSNLTLCSCWQCCLIQKNIYVVNCLTAKSIISMIFTTTSWMIYTVLFSYQKFFCSWLTKKFLSQQRYISMTQTECTFKNIKK